MMDRQRKFKMSIRWKLMIVMTSLMVSLVLTLTYFQLSGQQRMLEAYMEQRIELKKENLIHRGRSLVISLADNVAKDIAGFNFSSALDSIKERVEKNPEIKYAALKSFSGKTVIFPDIVVVEMFNENEWTGEPLALADIKVAEKTEGGEAVVEMQILLQVSPMPWGILKVVFKLSAVEQEAKAYARQIQQEIKSAAIRTGLMAACFILLCISIVYVLASKLTMPLIRLTNSAKQVPSGDFELEVDIGKYPRDEVGLLAEALVEMSRNLKMSYQKQAEYNQQLAGYSKLLEQKVIERTEALDSRNIRLNLALKEIEAAKKEAEIANRAKGVFLANMSHEIRTPLNAILGMTNVTLKTQPLSVKARHNLTIVQSSASFLLTLINEILDFSKIEAGKMCLEQNRFNIREVMNTLASMFSFKAAEKGLELIFATDDDLPEFLVGDSYRLSQVLINLISNAIKFTSHGQVLVTVSPNPGNESPLKTDAATEAPDAETEISLWFSIKDTGIGILKETVTGLFSPFTQAEVSFTRKFGGTGLGLSISKRIVELMNGRIWVESVPEVGSVFSFTARFEIPLQSGLEGEAAAPIFEAESEVAPMNHVKASNSRRCRILLVEDNLINQQVAVEILQSEGISVELAENGKEAVAAVTGRGPYDMVLMDIRMPEMDGFEATKIIRESEQKDIPIIAMTAHAMQGDKEKCLSQGMNDYVSKPLDPDLLIAVIEKWAPKTARLTEMASEKPRTADKPSPLPDFLPGLHVALCLKRINGNMALFKNLLTEFISLVINMPDQLTTAFNNDDIDGVKQMLHKLKGVAGNISATQIHQIADKLDHELSSSRSENFSQYIHELRSATDEITETITLVQELLKSAEKTELLADVPTFSGAAVKDLVSPLGSGAADHGNNFANLISDLSVLLLQNNVKAEDHIRLVRKHLENSRFREQAMRMETHVNNFDFKRAYWILADVAQEMGFPLREGGEC